MKKILEFFEVNIWWSITQTVTWWLVNLSKPENSIRHPELDFFTAYSEDGKWIYYEDCDTGKIYKVRRDAERM